MSVALMIAGVLMGCAYDADGALERTYARDRPVLAHLPEFERAPAKGPEEAEFPPTTRPGAATNPATAPAHWPGRGLAEHPFLYYGEGSNTVYVVAHGRVIWSYTFPRGGEIDDAWVLSNGHVIVGCSGHCYEVTPGKRVVWKYDAPAGTQIHSLQPVGLEQVAVVENGLPPRFVILNKRDNSIAMSHELPASSTDPKSVHTQFRNCRITRDGTYLINFLKEGRVVEYDKEWKQIWEYKTTMPWSAVRLNNGNTLIPGDNQAYVREVDKSGTITWSVERDDFKSMGIVLRDVQTANRLANGNTVFCNRSGSDKTHKFDYVQVVEVTPEKRVVWVLQDWEALTSATGVQLLDEPGMPEEPGALKR